MKDRLNREKHGLALEVAAAIFATPSVQWTSLRERHGEVRYVAVGLLEGLEFTCVFTMRRQVARINRCGDRVMKKGTASGKSGAHRFVRDDDA